MSYKERIDLLVNSIKKSKLNEVEISMLYGVIDLSNDRNDFEKQYNERIDEILKRKGDIVDV